MNLKQILGVPAGASDSRSSCPRKMPQPRRKNDGAGEPHGEHHALQQAGPGVQRAVVGYGYGPDNDEQRNNRETRRQCITGKPSPPWVGRHSSRHDDQPKVRTREGQYGADSVPDRNDEGLPGSPERLGCLSCGFR